MSTSSKFGSRTNIQSLPLPITMWRWKEITCNNCKRQNFQDVIRIPFPPNNHGGSEKWVGPSNSSCYLSNTAIFHVHHDCGRWKKCFVTVLGGGFKYFAFSPLFGEDEPILTSIFVQMGLVQPPTSVSPCSNPQFANFLQGFVAFAEAAAAYQQGHEVAKKCLGDQHPLTSPGSI